METRMEIKCTRFPEDSKDFPWDEKALETFKTNIKESGITCRMDDIFLLGFLRARKFDQERSLRLLKNYYTRRCEYPMYFKDMLPSKVENALSCKYFQFLKDPDQKGRYIIVFQIGEWDPSVANVVDYFKTYMLHYDFQLNFHRTQVNSVVVIVDSAGMSLRHLYEFSPRFLNSISTIIFKDSYQLRFAELHYVNLNVIVKTMLSFLIPFLPQKYKSRINLHSDMKTLHEFVHPQYLPEDYGGDLPKFDATEASQMLRDNEDFFKMNEKYIQLFEEANKKKFNEGHFRYLDKDRVDDQDNEILEKSESKFKELKENPESFLNQFEENIKLDVTHL